MRSHAERGNEELIRLHIHIYFSRGSGLDGDPLALLQPLVQITPAVFPDVQEMLANRGVFDFELAVPRRSLQSKDGRKPGPRPASRRGCRT